MSKHKIKQRTRRRGLSFPTLLIAAGFLAFGLLVYDAARPRPGRAVAYLGNEHIPVPADRNLQLNTANVGAALRIARPMGISRSPHP